MNLYEDLGVSKDADAATIKRAYRKRAQKAHPDKGGTKEAFHQVQLAHDVLGDPKRRAEYDRTGNTAERESIETVVLREIAGMLFQLVDRADVEHTNLVESMRFLVRNAQKEYAKSILEVEQSIERRQKASKRLTRKRSGGNAALAGMLNADIEQRRRQIESIKAQAEVTSAVLKELDEYDYAVAEKIRPTQWLEFPTSITAR